MHFPSSPTGPQATQATQAIRVPQESPLLNLSVLMAAGEDSQSASTLLCVCAVSSASVPHAPNCRRSSKHGHLHVLGADFQESIFWEFSAALREVTTWPPARCRFLGHFDLFKGHSCQDSPTLNPLPTPPQLNQRSLPVPAAARVLIKQRVSPAFSNLCPRGWRQCPLYSVHGSLQFSHLSSKLSVMMCTYDPRTQEAAAGETVQDQHGLQETLL